MAYHKQANKIRIYRFKSPKSTKYTFFPKLNSIYHDTSSQLTSPNLVEKVCLGGSIEVNKVYPFQILPDIKLFIYGPCKIILKTGDNKKCFSILMNSFINDIKLSSLFILLSQEEIFRLHFQYWSISRSQGFLYIFCLARKT